MLQMMKYELREIPTHVFLGITEEEKAAKQTVLTSLSFEFDPAPAIKTDDIDQTVDYEEIYNFIQNFPRNQRFNLIERLHSELLSALKQEFPDIKNLHLRIEKFPFEDGSVVVEN